MNYERHKLEQEPYILSVKFAMLKVKSETKSDHLSEVLQE